MFDEKSFFQRFRLCFQTEFYGKSFFPLKTIGFVESCFFFIDRFSDVFELVRCPRDDETSGRLHVLQDRGAGRGHLGRSGGHLSGRQRQFPHRQGLEQHA